MYFIQNVSITGRHYFQNRASIPFDDFMKIAVSDLQIADCFFTSNVF
jgi:hypothetical protein